MTNRFHGFRTGWIVLSALAALVFAASCRRIPLYDPQSGVYLKLDIRLAIDVDLSADIQVDGNPALENKVYGKTPEMVRVCFYDTETHKLESEDFLPPDGGFINIQAGTYDVVIYSLGTESTQVTGAETRAGSYAYTSNTGVKVKNMPTKAEGDDRLPKEVNVIHEPDHLFVGRMSGVEIPVHSEMDETLVLECEMKSLVETYTFEVKYVEGAGNIQTADVYITGQAPLKYLWDERYLGPACAIYFQSEIDLEKGHLFSVFNTFGKFPNAENQVFLNVLVTTGGGGKYQWVFDVTDQFDNPDNLGHEIVIEDPIVVPDGGSGTGGFDPVVSDWDVEIIEIPLS